MHLKSSINCPSSLKAPLLHEACFCLFSQLVSLQKQHLLLQELTNTSGAFLEESKKTIDLAVTSIREGKKPTRLGLGLFRKRGKERKKKKKKSGKTHMAELRKSSQFILKMLKFPPPFKHLKSSPLSADGAHFSIRCGPFYAASGLGGPFSEGV